MANFDRDTTAGRAMLLDKTHPITENELYLKLFVTNGGGW